MNEEEIKKMINEKVCKEYEKKFETKFLNRQDVIKMANELGLFFLNQGIEIVKKLQIEWIKEESEKLYVK